MPEAVVAFGWGMAAASGVLVGAILGLFAHLRHRAIAAVMSLGAGLMLSAAMFSLANAALVGAQDRKRCGECKPQPSEADAPGSGASIALGTALDAVPEALVLGVTLRAGGPDLALVLALALANAPEAVSGTAGMR